MRPSHRAIGSPLDAPHKFEAYLIQSMIEHMLPEHADSTFGSGFSGDAWRSMMAERIADVVATHGGFGVAARLIGKTLVQGEQK
jgi:peptidoglycan hydrolase FlgJ